MLKVIQNEKITWLFDAFRRLWCFNCCGERQFILAPTGAMQCMGCGTRQEVD